MQDDERPCVVARRIGKAARRPEGGDALDLAVAQRPAERLQSRIDGIAYAGGDDDITGPAHRANIEARRGLRHAVAELGAELGGARRRGSAFRVHAAAAWGDSRYGDAQPAGIGADLLQEWSLRGGRAMGSARCRPGDRVEQRGAAAHAPGDCVPDRHAAPALADEGSGWRARPRRLQAEDAAIRGGYPDRAAAIGRV